MAVAWTTIPNGDVDVDSPLTTALMTALRDNPEGIAQRASGAPKIFGNPYDYQEFTANGTWTKPSNAETGDKVIVHLVGGGGSGIRSSNTNGGAGGSGIMYTFEDIDDLASTEPVVVGAGGVGTVSGVGNTGGDSSFGTAAASSGGVRANYIKVGGGAGGGLGSTPAEGGAIFVGTETDKSETTNYDGINKGGMGGAGAANPIEPSGSSIYGGGGGGGVRTGSVPANGTSGGISNFAGDGGDGTDDTGVPVAGFEIDGRFPGGGGAAVHTSLSDDTVSGAGADGVVRVWCIKEG